MAEPWQEMLEARKGLFLDAWKRHGRLGYTVAHVGHAERDKLEIIYRAHAASLERDYRRARGAGSLRHECLEASRRGLPLLVIDGREYPLWAGCDEIERPDGTCTAVFLSCWFRMFGGPPAFEKLAAASKEYHRLVWSLRSPLQQIAPGLGIETLNLEYNSTLFPSWTELICVVTEQERRFWHDSDRTYPWDAAKLRGLAEWAEEEDTAGPVPEQLRKWARNLPDYWLYESGDVFMASADTITWLLRKRDEGENESYAGPFRPKELVKMFDCSWDTVKRRFESGVIRCKRLSAQAYLIHPADLPKDWKSS